MAADPQILAFTTFSLAADEAGLTRAVAAAPGCLAQFFGRKIEEPGVGVHVVVWRSVKDEEAFRETYVSELKQISAAGEKSPPAPELYALPTADSAAAVMAVLSGSPCTEVFSGYGTEAGFAADVRTFAARVDAARPVGCLGMAVVESLRDDVPVVGGEEGEKGGAVKLLIGWTSREAHLEAKDKPGPIGENIGLLRRKRKQVGLYHVQFKQI